MVEVKVIQINTLSGVCPKCSRKGACFPSFANFFGERFGFNFLRSQCGGGKKSSNKHLQVRKGEWRAGCFWIRSFPAISKNHSKILLLIIMITANTLAKKSEVSHYNVCHYTRIGLLKPSRNRQNAYKIYQPADATRLRSFQSAKSVGFSLTEIKEILNEAGASNLLARWFVKLLRSISKKIAAKLKNCKNCKRKWKRP
jgi:DNA-binding transcriptional MerR regulator